MGQPPPPNPPVSSLCFRHILPLWPFLLFLCIYCSICETGACYCSITGGIIASFPNKTQIDPLCLTGGDGRRRSHVIGSRADLTPDRSRTYLCHTCDPAQDSLCLINRLSKLPAASAARPPGTPPLTPPPSIFTVLSAFIRLHARSAHSLMHG